MNGRKWSVVCAAALTLSAAVSVAAGEVLLVDDEGAKPEFTVGVLKNALGGTAVITANKEYVKEGNQAVQLAYKVSGKGDWNVVEYRARVLDRDFSKMEAVSLWIYGNNDPRIYLQLGFSGSDTGYFVYDIGPVNWTGWKKIVVPRGKFEYLGSFPDWENIEWLIVKANGEVAVNRGESKAEDSGTLYLDRVTRLDKK